jgi:hypothetical protein
MEKLMADLPPETYEALKKREPEQLVKLAPYIPSSIFKQLSHDKEIPKATRNRMKDARFKDVKDLIDQADRLPKNANGSPAKFNSDGSVNKDYKLIQDKLFNHFKYSGMKSEDVVQMMQHHHDLFQSAVLLDGGMTNGAKMAIIDSADFGDAQKEVAKRTWQKGVKDNLAGSGIETLMPDKYEEAGRDSAFAGMPPEQITQIIADANSTLVNDGKGNMVPQFDNAVNKMKAYFTGKQPMEVARQVHEDDLLSPAFAAAASVQAISALPQVMDPPYLAAMTDNIVNLLHSGQITDPQDKKRLQTALHYMTTNAGTAYRGYFSDALAKAGVGEKEILAGFNATGDEAPAAINPIPVYITDPPTSS